MSVWKRLQIAALGWIGFLVLYVLFRTVRWQRKTLDEQEKDAPPRIYAIWHGRVLMSPFAYRSSFRKNKPRPIFVLVSRHFDGQLIGAVLRHAGLGTVSGSSTRGGAIGMLGLIRAVRTGSNVAIMPDGPRGPRYEVKAGTIKAASETGAPIYPFTAAFQRYWKFGSWDGMILPKPFTRGVALVGRPLTVPAKLDDEILRSARDTLRAGMMELMDEADSHVYS